MIESEAPYQTMVWVLCVPDPKSPGRIVPFLTRNRGAVWFSEPQFADRFIRENPELPAGARSRAILGGKRILSLAGELEKAGVHTLYSDLEYGKDSPGESLAAFTSRLAKRLTGTESLTPLPHRRRLRTLGSAAPTDD